MGKEKTETDAQFTFLGHQIELLTSSAVDSLSWELIDSWNKVRIARACFQMFAFMGEFEKVSEITPYLYLTSGTGAEVDSVKVIPNF